MARKEGAVSDLQLELDSKVFAIEEKERQVVKANKKFEESNKKVRLLEKQLRQTKEIKMKELKQKLQDSESSKEPLSQLVESLKMQLMGKDDMLKKEYLKYEKLEKAMHQQILQLKEAANH